MLQGVIFDIDGTLVDSNDAHAQSWVDTFAEAGYDVPFDVVRPLIGMGGDKLLPKAAQIGHEKEERTVHQGDAVLVPAGTYHNVVNTSKTEMLKLYTIYSPPNHPDGTVHKTKAEAEAAELIEHS